MATPVAGGPGAQSPAGHGLSPSRVRAHFIMAIAMARDFLVKRTESFHVLGVPQNGLTRDQMILVTKLNFPWGNRQMESARAKSRRLKHKTDITRLRDDGGVWRDCKRFGLSISFKQTKMCVRE